MEVAPFFVDFHHFLSIFTIYALLSRFTHFFRKFFLAKIAFPATSHVFCMYEYLFGWKIKSMLINWTMESCLFSRWSSGGGSITIFWLIMIVLPYTETKSICEDYWWKLSFIFVGPLPGPTMKCVCRPPTTHPRHLAQRLKAALQTVPRLQTHTFSGSACQ